MFKVTINLFNTAKYNGTFDCASLEQAISKVKNNLYINCSVDNANFAIGEIGEARYWCEDGNAKIIKA